MKEKLTKDPGSKVHKINPSPHLLVILPQIQKFDHIHMARLNVYRECTGVFVPALDNIAGSGIVGAGDDPLGVAGCASGVGAGGIEVSKG